MNPVKTIEVEIYKGKAQPITEQRQCKIVIYDNYLEYIYDYDYKDLNSGESESLISASFIPKHQLSLDLTEVVKDDDPTNERVAVIHIKTPSSSERVYIGDITKAEKLYNTIKRWLIS